MNQSVVGMFIYVGIKFGMAMCNRFLKIRVLYFIYIYK
jgi:hypothetical protein